MPYEDFEESEYGGEPVYLLRFENNKYGIKLYCNAVRQITIGADVYLPLPVTISNIKSTKDIQTSEVTVSIPRNHELSSMLNGPFNNLNTNLTVWRAHRKDLSDSIVSWRGRVVSTTTSSDKTDITCENLHTILKKQGNIAKYQKLCRHSLYSAEPRCGVSYDAFKVAGLITGYSGGFSFDVDTASAQPDGYYKGGILDAGGNLGFIISHVGTTLILITPLDGIDIGDSVFIAPGCDLAIKTCDKKFNNKHRHGGFVATPRTTPHGGTNIFSAG